MLENYHRWTIRNKPSQAQIFHRVVSSLTTLDCEHISYTTDKRQTDRLANGHFLTTCFLTEKHRSERKSLFVRMQYFSFLRWKVKSPSTPPQTHQPSFTFLYIFEKIFNINNCCQTQENKQLNSQPGKNSQRIFFSTEKNCRKKANEFFFMLRVKLFILLCLVIIVYVKKWMDADGSGGEYLAFF